MIITHVNQSSLCLTCQAMMPILMVVETMMGLLRHYTSLLMQVAGQSIIIFMRFFVALLVMCSGIHQVTH
jgi:hypothetical protein